MLYQLLLKNGNNNTSGFDYIKSHLKDHKDLTKKKGGGISVPESIWE